LTVVVVGDVNVDLHLVLPTTIDGRGEHANPDATLSGGGSAANAAAALARLGVATRFVGMIGNDTYGVEAVKSLADAGVDTTAIQTSPDGMTVMVLVVVPADGDRLIYVWPPRGGAHLGLVVDVAAAGIRDASWIHVSGIALRGEPAASSILQAMETARSAGVPVSLDVNLRLENWGWESGFRDTITAAIERSDIVLGGAIDEICPLVGGDDPHGAVAELATAGRIVVGRLGADGAIAHDGDRSYSAGGFEVEVVDTVGAGDAFDAGFIAARLRGESLEPSLRYANAVAALAIGRQGARSTPGHDHVMGLIGTSDG
jgi:sugar/nucleoside kinase (ribokinase family)